MANFAPLLTMLLLRVAPTDAAAAPPDTVELRWTGPEDCPDAAEVRRRVSTDAGALPVTADAVVTQDETGWSVALRIEGSAGVDARTLRGESCEALADAAALLVGVAAAPQSGEVDARPDPEPQTEPTPKPKPAPRPAQAPAPPTDPPTPESVPPAVPERAPDRSARPPLDLGVHARASGLLQLGALLPGNVTGGAQAAIGLSIPWVRVEARGSYLAARRIRDTNTTTADVGADIDGWSAGASGCGVWEGSRLFVPLCLGAQLGRARARAFGLEQSGTGRGLWAHAVVDAGLGVRLAPRWAVVAEAEAVVSLRRPAFRVRDRPTLFQPSAAAARLLVGVEVALRE